MCQEYSNFLQFNVSDNPQRKLVSASHGFEVFKVLASEALQELGMLNKQNYNHIITNEFISYLISKQSEQFFKEKPITVEEFKLFIAFTYRQTHDICSDILELMVDPRIVQHFLEYEPTKNPKSILSLASNNQSSQSFGSVVYNIAEKLDSKIVEPQNSALISNNNSRNNDNQEKIQQSDYFAQIGIINNNNNNNNNNKILNLENNLIGLSNKSTATDNKEQQQQQQQKVEQIQNSQINNEQVVQNQFAEEVNLNPIAYNKSKEYEIQIFNEFVKRFSQTPDAISELHLMRDQNPLIKFQHIFTIVQQNKFKCEYWSESLGIPRVPSSVLPEKKKAQHYAARLFLAHLHFYQKFNKPFFQNEDQQFIYNQQLEKREREMQDDPSGVANSNVAELGDHSDEEEYDYQKDFELLLEYDQEIVHLTQLIQQQVRVQSDEIIKLTQNRVSDGFFQCVATFEHNRKILVSEGRGRSQKDAKQIAYIKLQPLVIEYFFPENKIPAAEEPKVEQYGRYNQEKQDENPRVGGRGNRPPPANQKKQKEQSSIFENIEY